ncbi:MAG: sugar ABC transporter permease [Defluviitaleaceae bacterium]|nr:sugar ABC transporter permease [Defluviitaleaceae bacterium]MCL2275324.1 sugar ABC transporter permease [Defluviitaleaceae bacterium]
MDGTRPTLLGTLKAYIYLLPALLVLGTFSIYPLFRSLFMAFTTVHRRTLEVEEVGLHNFRFLMDDPRFALALRNTFTFVLGVVPVAILISLGIAVLLNQKIRGATFFRSIFFLPFVTSTIAIAMVWNWIFHERHGLLNYFLGFVGVDPRPWIDHPDHAMTALIIMSIWSRLGFNIIILLAGMQTIDKQLYLAAKVDGASAWHRFKTVTVPLLSPSIFFLTVMGVIGSFRVFGEIYALFPGGATAGPANSALTVVYYVFQRFWDDRNFGLATAAALVLFVIILCFTLLQFWVGKKLVHYK